MIFDGNKVANQKPDLLIVPKDCYVERVGDDLYTVEIGGHKFQNCTWKMVADIIRKVGK